MENEDNDNEVREDILLWQQELGTRRFAASAKKNTVELHSQLIARCTVSTDPDVRWLSAQYLVWKDVAEQAGARV